MKLSIFHKNIKVLDFELNEKDFSILNVNKIFNEKYLPIGLFQNSDLVSDLNKWWKSRSIPQSRQELKNANEIFFQKNIFSTLELMQKNHGLSLTDHYWIQCENENLLWENINYFDNDFSEDIGKTLFGEYDKDIESLSFDSPDSATDGQLKKMWIIDENKNRYLLKGGSGLGQFEVFNEYLASEICSRLNFDFVPYKIIQKKDGRFYSACPCFITKETEFISAYRVFILKKYDKGLFGKYEHFVECLKTLNINDEKFEKMEKKICQMFILDFLIANTDRHFGNFGFIRDSNTLEFLDLAPIFDNGTSLFFKVPTQVLKNKENTNSQNIIARPFGYKHNDQIELFPFRKYCSDLNFDVLDNIDEFYKNILVLNSDISEERRNILGEILKNRVQEMKSLMKNRKLPENYFSLF